MRLKKPLALFPAAVLLILLAHASPTEACHRLQTDEKILCGPGSDSLKKQNDVADRFNLPRVANEEMLEKLIKEGVFVQIPADTPYYYLSLEPKFRYGLPVTKEFIGSFSRRFSGTFTGNRLKITEIVRTKKRQNFFARILRITSADCRTPSRCSSHLTGAAFDISAKDLIEDQIKWIRKELARLEREGIIEATDETDWLNHFHIMVFPRERLPDWSRLLKQEIKNEPEKKLPPAKKPSKGKQKRSRR